jgi:hypothetical protein
VNLVATVLAAVVMASPAVVSHIGDERIQESSGLAYSVRHPDLVYTMNDSGNRPMVFAIQVSTGQVVGETDLSDLELEDPESIAVDPQGMLWLGDLGDNDRDRDDVSIVAFEEPGPGKAAPRSLQRFAVRYDSGPSNVEAMLVSPTSRQIFLISKKNEDGGKPNVFALPQTLRADQPNVATNLNRPMPNGVSDATFTPDGSLALVETASKVLVYDARTWGAVGEFPGPGLPKGESMTIEPGGKSVLMGTEGENSPLVRIELPEIAVAKAQPTAAPTPTPAPTDAEVPPVGALTGPDVTPVKSEPIGIRTWGPIAGLVVIAAGFAVFRLIQRRRRLALRHRRIDQRLRD